MIRFKDTDYLYASARVKALENSMISKADLLKMARAATFSDAWRMAQEKGIGAAHSEEQYEEALLEKLEMVYRDVEEMANSKELAALFRHKYDGHNLKTLVKAQKLGDDRNHLLSPLGNVPKEEIAKQHREGAYSKLAPCLAAAARDASEALAKSGDPQQVDTRLDSAVFAAMTESLAELDNGYLRRVIEAQIDIYNVRAFIRVKRMKKDVDFLKKILVDGGSLDAGRLLAAYSKGFEELFDLLRPTSMGKELEPAFDSIRNGGALSEMEKLCDNHMLGVIREAKRVSFGIEPLIAYLLARESEVKDIRIVLASKAAGVASAQIEERLRDTYE